MKLNIIKLKNYFESSTENNHFYMMYYQIEKSLKKLL